MNTVQHILTEWTAKFSTDSIIKKFLFSIIAYILIRIAFKAVHFLIDRLTIPTDQALKVKKSLHYIRRLVFILCLLPIWLANMRNILTFMGLFSAGLAFAFKDVISSILGWVIIVMNKPFQTGDRIQIGNVAGDIMEINTFYTTILEVNQSTTQSTGNFISIPNIKLLMEPVFNETKIFPYAWGELYIYLTLDSNWELAKDILQKIAGKYLGAIVEEAKESITDAWKKYPIFYTKLNPMIYTSIEQGRIVLTLRFMAGARNARNMQHQVYEEVLKQFSVYEDIKLK